MQGSRRSFGLVAGFLVLAFGLQWGWSELRGSAVERWVIHDLTVGAAVKLLAITSPDVGAWAEGARIRAAGGGLNVLNGCEGTEVFFLLVAALLVSPLPWAWRLGGIAAGGVWVFAWNQVRLLALFHAHRTDREWFSLLHGLVGPAVLIALTLLFVMALYRLHERQAPAPSAEPT